MSAICAAFATAVVFPIAVFAQIAVNPESIELRTTPEFPTAYQSVRVTADSNTTNLSESYLEWFVDGKKATGGVGITTFSFQTGGFGVASQIIVTAKTQNGNTVQRGLEVRPADVNISYEALSYVPPFYKGRAVYTYQTPIRVIAIPELGDANGRKLASNSLLFSWQVDDRLQQSMSGLGKDTAVLKASIPLKETAITVTVSTLDGKTTTSKRITVKPVAPKIVLYQLSPIYGLMFNSALTNSEKLAGQEMTIAAIPYFFDTSDPKANMIYTWSMNGVSIGEGQKDNTLTVRQIDDSAGTSNVSLNAKHARDIFEYDDAAVSISFGQEVKAGAF